MSNYPKNLIGAVCLGLVAASASACSSLSLDGDRGQSDGITLRDDKVTVMMLGTYHFNNPGQDLYNAEADDVLAAKRQAELEVLSEVLASFKPTVIAVEATAPPPYADADWQKFTQDDLATQRNETVQIGYRVAHKAGIDRVYAIDEQPSEGEPDYFPFGEVMRVAKSSGRDGELNEMTSVIGEFIGAFDAAQKQETIPQLLMRMNGIDITDIIYWDVIEYGVGEDQAGPDLAAYYFLRNAKIFNKLTQVTKSGDRVLIVYGAGHKAWLDRIINNMSGYELEPVMPYLERAAARLEKQQ